LHVAGRTSSFSFKGKSEDLRAIGQKLNVKTVLEGSVQRAGDRLRITTQLINAADGYHVWSETYDRKLTDVFAVQDEIARSVVAALKVQLLPERAAGSRGPPPTRTRTPRSCSGGTSSCAVPYKVPACACDLPQGGRAGSEVRSGLAGVAHSIVPRR